MLFLDELAEFNSLALESLRHPSEDKVAAISCRVSKHFSGPISAVSDLYQITVSSPQCGYPALFPGVSPHYF